MQQGVLPEHTGTAQLIWLIFQLVTYAYNTVCPYSVLTCIAKKIHIKIAVINLLYLKMYD